MSEGRPTSVTEGPDFAELEMLDRSRLAHTVSAGTSVCVNGVDAWVGDREADTEVNSSREWTGRPAAFDVGAVEPDPKPTLTAEQIAVGVGALLVLMCLGAGVAAMLR